MTVQCEGFPKKIRYSVKQRILFPICPVLCNRTGDITPGSLTVEFFVLRKKDVIKFDNLNEFTVCLHGLGVVKSTDFTDEG